MSEISRYETLEAEIRNDPEGIGYGAMDRAERLDVLNAPDMRWGTRRDPHVRKERLQQFCFERNLVAPWKAAMRAEEPHLAALADTANQLIFGSELNPINVDNPAFLAQVDALVNAGLFDTRDGTGSVIVPGSANKSAVLSLADVPLSRAEELLGAGEIVTDDDLNRANG